MQTDLTLTEKAFNTIALAFVIRFQNEAELETPIDEKSRVLDILAALPLDAYWGYNFDDFFYDLGGPNGFGDGRGGFRAFGNFFHLSHAFTIDGTAEEVEPLRLAIKANLQTPAFAYTKEQNEKRKAEKKALEREQEEARERRGR